jgi:hypothetical protein
MSNLVESRLKELLEYTSETGEMKWKTTGKGRRLDRIAGSPDRHGYLQTRIDGAIYFNHRLAWLYVHGQFPQGVIDHIDGNPINNAIANLRDVPQRLNMENQRRAPISNKSTGLIGVSKHKLGYMAKIQSARKQIYLGIFQTPEAAHEAYVVAKRQLHAGGTL